MRNYVIAFFSTAAALLTFPASAQWFYAGDGLLSGQKFDEAITLNASSTFSASWWAVIGDYMEVDDPKSGSVVISGAVTLDVTDCWDDSGNMDYRSCMMLWPQATRADINGLPDGLGRVTNGNAAANLAIDSDHAVYVYFDNLTISVDESNLDKDTCILDLGNGWQAGLQSSGGTEPYGKLGGVVQVAGLINVLVTQQDNTDWAGQGIMEMATDDRFSDGVDDTLVPVCAHAATYTDASGLTVRFVDWDSSDIGIHVAQSPGFKWPVIDIQNTSGQGGEGFKVYGAMNGTTGAGSGGVGAASVSSRFRGSSYGGVFGDLSNGGIPTYDATCDSTNCTADTEPAGTGLEVRAAIIEGAAHALIVDYGATRSVDIESYFECPDCDAGAAIFIKPKGCDGLTGTTPVERGMPVKSDGGRDSATNEADTCAASGGVAEDPPEYDLQTYITLNALFPRVTGDSDADPIYLGEGFDETHTITFAPGSVLSQRSSTSDVLGFSPTVQGVARSGSNSGNIIAHGVSFRNDETDAVWPGIPNIVTHNRIYQGHADGSVNATDCLNFWGVGDGIEGNCTSDPGSYLGYDSEWQLYRVTLRKDGATTPQTSTACQIRARVDTNASGGANTDMEIVTGGSSTDSGAEHIAVYGSTELNSLGESVSAWYNGIRTTSVTDPSDIDGYQLYVNAATTADLCSAGSSCTCTSAGGDLLDELTYEIEFIRRPL